MKVLLLSDDFSHIQAFKARAQGWKVSVARSKPEFVKKMRVQSFDLVFVESYLEDCEGPELIPVLKKLQQVVIAHGASDEENIEMLHLGARASLKKEWIYDRRFFDFLVNCRDLFVFPRGQ